MLRLWRTVQQFISPFNCVFNIIPTPSPRERVETETQMPPDLPLEIWLEIFRFATYVYQDVSIKPFDPFTPTHMITNAMGVNTPSMAMRTKTSLVLVSRAWRRVALEILYRHIIIRSPIRANIILKTLQTSQSHISDSSMVEQPSVSGHGQYVRHVEVFTFTRGSRDIKYLQVIFEILRLCPNLRTLSGRWIHILPVEFLNGLSTLLGSKLSELCWSERTSGSPNTNTNLTFLSGFQSLRVLDLRHFAGSKPSSWPENGPNLALPVVHSLILSMYPTRGLEAATRFRLPSLQNLTLINSVGDDGANDLLRTFLKAHGGSLAMIDVRGLDPEPDPDNALSRPNASQINPDIFLAGDICPNLETIVFCVSSPVMQPCVHPNLRRIGLRGVNADALYPDKPSLTKDHLMSFDIDKFPTLEMIQTIGFLVEANSDSLAKDLFIWWVERFEPMDVLLVDGEGVLWAYDTDPTHEPTIVNGKMHNNNPTTLSKPILDSTNQSKAEAQYTIHRLEILP